MSDALEKAAAQYRAAEERAVAAANKMEQLRKEMNDTEEEYGMAQRELHMARNALTSAAGMP